MIGQFVELISIGAVAVDFVDEDLSDGLVVELFSVVEVVFVEVPHGGPEGGFVVVEFDLHCNKNIVLEGQDTDDKGIIMFLGY